MGKIFTLVLLLLLLLLLLPTVCCHVSLLRNPSYIQIRSRTYKWDREGAVDLCRQNFTDMLTIRNADENLWLKPFAGWIGLYQEDPYPWRWSKGDEEASFVSWYEGQPEYGEKCAYKPPNTEKWHGGQCYGWGVFLCSEDRVILVKEEKTWEEALAHCRALEALDPSKPAQHFNNHRYDLATILYQDDIDFAREKAEGGTTDEVWTGLRFIAGHWLWVDGEPVQVGQQIPTEPTPGSLGSCGALRVQSTDSIQARDCALRKNFLCYKKFHDQIIEIVE